MALKNQTILVTGGTGYIGSHAVVQLLEVGAKVIILDNLCNSKREVVNRIETITSCRPEFIVGDIRDAVGLHAIFKSYKIDSVIHFAGLKAVAESVANPIEYYANNVQGTISLLQAMSAWGVKKLVFSSSATVYGQPQYLPLDENHPTNVVNAYGRTKLHIEQILNDVVFSDPEWGIVCLRYFNPVGSHNSGLIGESPNGVPNNLMPYVAQVAVGQRQRLSVFGSDYQTPDGTGIRDYIHVMDLAEGHSAALEYLIDKKGLHVFNLGTGRGYSVLEVISAFELANGVSIPYTLVPRRQGDVAQCYGDSSKAEKYLGWKAKRDITSMCASAWQFQLGLSKPRR